MEVSLIIILVLAGAYSAFLSALINNLSYEEISRRTDKEPDKSAALHKLKSKNDETGNSFYIVEMIGYAIAGAIIGGTVIQTWGNWAYCLYGCLIFYLTAFSLRSAFYALGKRYANELAYIFFSSILFFSYLGRPIQLIAVFFNNKLGKEDNYDAAREEITALLESSHEEGSLDPEEYRILKNMMHFSSVLVSDVMTPRTVIFSCRGEMTVGEVLNMPELQMYSRFPIWEGDSLDAGVTGYVMSKDVLIAALKGKSSMKLSEFRREVYFIPENAELDNALEKFLQRRQHLFVVVDEYGGVEGLLTMEDVLETILGVEIVDEADRVVDLRQFAKQRRDRRVATKLQKSEE